MNLKKKLDNSMINTPENTQKLAKAIVTAARIVEQHYKFEKNHNYVMAEALIQAAADAGVRE